jgi:protein-glucosylgalactosylhydroxylysine glucosidase
MFETLYTAPDGSFTVQHLVYPHRYYNRAIINNIVVTRLSGPAVNINVDIEQNLGDASLDLFMEQPGQTTINGNVVAHVCGHTKDIEDEMYQKTPSSVCTMQYPAVVPTQVTLNGGSANGEFTIVTVVGNWFFYFCCRFFFIIAPFFCSQR